MIFSLPTAAKRAICCLAIAGGGIALATTEAQAFQSDGLNPGAAAQDAAAAGGQANGWTYGVRGTLSFLRQESINAGFGGSGFAVLPFTTDLEFEGEVGLQFMNTQKNGLPEGGLRMFPIRATLRVQMWRFGGSKPYLGGGAGFYLFNFSQDSATKDRLNQQGFGTSVSIDPGVGVHVAGGTEWERGRFHVGVDVKYVFGSTDVESTVVDTVTGNIFREAGSLDIDGFWIAVGARFSF